MRTKILAATTLAASLMLAACGGGDDGVATPPTLNGTAAVGVPIVGGAVKVVCAGGSALSTTTGSAGAWQVTTSGQTLPCAVQVSGGTVGGSANGTPYHSIALNFDTVNITPLTDLVIASLAGKAPGAWFEGINTAALQGVDNAAVTSALGKVNTALGLTATLNGANPLTTPFTATNGNLIDDILEAIAKARLEAGLEHAALLALASQTSFSAPASFNFSTAYAAVKASGSGTGTGNGNLTVQFTAGGVSFPAISASNVPAPGSESEFCQDAPGSAIFAQIAALGGGSLTMNTCSFAGNVGKVGATLNLAGLPIPYVITFTFH